MAGLAPVANSRGMVRRTDLRDSSRARGIGGLDFRAKKRPRNVFYVVVDLFFCWKQRAAAKSCGVSCLAVFLCPSAVVKNANGFPADRVAVVRMVAGSRLISARSDSHRAVLCDGGGVWPDHYLVSKSRDWRRGNCHRFIPTAPG